jgi:leader peptidase (prepilin peptidase)/N-methyltransferase
MMERDWHAQAAELRGEEPPAGERFNLATPALALPALRPPDHALENIPWSATWCCAGAAGTAAPASASATRSSSPHRAAVGLAAWHFGFDLRPSGALLFALGNDRAHLHRPRHPVAARRHHPAPAVARPGLQPRRHLHRLPTAVIGAMAGYLSLWSVFWLFKLATGKEGMGYGDFKLLAAIGAWLGWQMLPASR